MWLLPKIKDELVTISCTPTTLACAWMQPSKKGLLYELKGYKRITLDNPEHTSALTHNPINIEKHITSFLHKHNLMHAGILIGLRHPAIYETIIDLPTALPDPADIPLPKRQQHLWSYRYLYSHDNAHAAFYVCSVPQSLLFTYKLLAFRQQLNVIAITTLSMAHLHAYTHGYGVAFRHSQLAQDMARCENNIDHVVSPDLIRRRLIIPVRYTLDLESELPTLIPLFGLTISERSM